MLVATDIMNGGRDSDGRSLVALWLSDVYWGLGGAIFVLFDKGERSLNMVRAFFRGGLQLFC